MDFNPVPIGAANAFEKAGAGDGLFVSAKAPDLIKNVLLNKQNLASLVGFSTLSILIFYFLSNGDFSFLLTYAAFIRCFGFFLLNFRMWGTMSAKGVSVKTLQIYLLVFTFRMYSILQHQGYLPYDKTGDWFYHVVEGLSLFGVGIAMYGVFSKLALSYDEKFDNLGGALLPNKLGALYLILPCLLLAIVFHPALNRDFLSDTAWTFSMYLEAIAMLPQIFMLHKLAKSGSATVESLIGHTMFALGFARVFELIFWWGSYQELAGTNGSTMPGCIVLASQLVHFLIMLDFFYLYLTAAYRGVPVEIPTYSFNNNNNV
jgi:hypothetical protein